MSLNIHQTAVVTLLLKGAIEHANDFNKRLVADFDCPKELYEKPSDLIEEATHQVDILILLIEGDMRLSEIDTAIHSLCDHNIMTPVETGYMFNTKFLAGFDAFYDPD